MRDAQIEDIARAVGINRAIVYRHFTGKEELFALTLTGYSTSCATPWPRDRPPGRPGRAPDRDRHRLRRLRPDLPGFVDCAQTLMRRTGPELLDEISESALFRLGRSISACLSVLSGVIDDGVAAGDFEVEDTNLLANQLYASALGGLQLARVGILVGESAPGIPTVGSVSPEQVRDFLVATALSVSTRRA